MVYQLFAERNTNPAPAVKIDAMGDGLTVHLPSDVNSIFVIAFPMGSVVDISQKVAPDLELPSSFTPSENISRGDLILTFDSVGTISFPADGKVRINGKVSMSPRKAHNKKLNKLRLE